jgi:cyclopropane-fatty-acyl-phospholipid synthase
MPAFAAWRRNFENAWDKAAGMMFDRFCRMWDYYLAGGLRGRLPLSHLAVFQIQLAKKVDAAPLTRSY